MTPPKPWGKKRSMTVSNLNFQDVVMVCNDMLTIRRPDVELSYCGKANLPVLEVYVKKAENLFPGISAGTPFALELGEEDIYHDASGTALIMLKNAYLEHPDVSKGVKDIMRMVGQVFITGANELGGTYASEAANAIQRKMQLPAHEAELKSIPLTFTGDPGAPASLYEWVSGFLNSGERIGNLLAQRADKANKVHAGLLRAEMLGTLGAFRDALAREAKALGTLPGDIDVRVFGYMDMLGAARAGGKKGGPAGEGSKTP